MKTPKFNFLILLLLSGLLYSCGQEADLITGSETPAPAAAVVNCDLQGPCVDINQWRPDINTALNDCFTETADAKCSLTNDTQVKEYLLGQSVQYPEATGGPLSPGCCFNDNDIDYKVAYYKNKAYDGRPSPTYGPNFSRCNWIVTHYNFAHFTNAAYNTWIFKLKVTYTKQCCPMKQVVADHQVADVRLQEIDDNPGDDGSPLGYEVAVLADPGYHGPGFVVNFLNENGDILESGEAHRPEGSETFIYHPSPDNLAIPGIVRVDAM